jgi:hypothetical protein
VTPENHLLNVGFWRPSRGKVVTLAAVGLTGHKDARLTAQLAPLGSRVGRVFCDENLVALEVSFAIKKRAYVPYF